MLKIIFWFKYTTDLGSWQHTEVQWSLLNSHGKCTEKSCKLSEHASCVLDNHANYHGSNYPGYTVQWHPDNLTFSYSHILDYSHNRPLHNPANRAKYGLSTADNWRARLIRIFCAVYPG